jgi:hypothetical protein
MSEKRKQFDDAKRQRFMKQGDDGYKYLPYFMRDFHDQKALFKSVELHLKREKEPYAVDWVAGQCYTVDKFLRFMALHGFTLQRSRMADIQFADIHKTLEEDRVSEVKAFQEMLSTTKKTERNQQ